MSYYADEENGGDATINLVPQAAKWYFDNNPSDSLRNYDKDGDGYLDGIMLIYGAPDYSCLENDNYSNLWAYCYWVQEVSEKNTANPGSNAFFWASYDFMYSSDKSRTRTGKTNYGGGDTSHCNIDAHTYTHEMGHMFGLEDYYDYSGQFSPAGGFSMQDANVGGHDPYSSYALGWGSAYKPTETTTIYLKPFSETGEMILLAPSYNSYNSPFDEYILVEYYTPTALNKYDSDYCYCNGYPQGPKTSGIRVWHVDARLLTYAKYPKTSNITINPNANDLYGHAMSNTYSGGNAGSDYISALGANYANYNVLQLIRNDTSINYRTDDNFSESSLFKTNATFTMSAYGKQFVKTGKLNQDVNLGWSFTINNLNSERASITVTKL